MRAWGVIKKWILRGSTELTNLGINALCNYHRTAEIPKKRRKRYHGPLYGLIDYSLADSLSRLIDCLIHRWVGPFIDFLTDSLIGSWIERLIE